MGVKGVYKRMPTISVRFITSTDTFTLQTNTVEQQSDAAILGSDSLVEQIISFNTENNMANDTPVFSLVLAGLDRWDRILQSNDIVTIKVNPGDGNTVVNDVVMVGMVSEVKKLGSYGDSSIVYQVSGQSMAKALMQIKLGTLQEIASITQSFGWMTSMGLKQQDGSVSPNVVPVKKPEKTVKLKTKAVPTTTKTYKDIDGKTFKLSDNIVIVTDGSGISNNQWIQVSSIGYVKAKVINKKDNLFFEGASVYVPMSSKASRDSFNRIYDTHGNNVIKLYSGKKNPKTEASDANKNTDIATDENGLLFSGKTASDVVGTIIRWFLNLSGDDLQLTSSLNNTDIQYTFNGERKNFGDWIELNLNSRTEDEMLLDQVPLMSFTGSLRQLITQAQAKPYNEFYTDFTSDEKAMFNMRPTPFEPDDWKELQGVATVLESKNIIEETLSRNDNEVYSVFSSSIPNSILLNSISDLMMYPVYFPGLTSKYGYSMLEQGNDYIFRSKKETKTKGGSDSSGSSLDIASGDTVTNAKNIANVLKKAGASGNAIAALLGTMQGESNLIPNKIQAGQSYEDSPAKDPTVGGYGFGLAQWDSSRRVELLRYAKAQNKSWDNLGLQLSFLLDHDGANSTMMKEFLVSNDSIDTLVGNMVAKWERPGDASGEIAKRIPYAKKWYSDLGLSSVQGKSSISTKGIGIGKTLTEALKVKNTSNKTLTDAMGIKNKYPTIGEQVAKEQAAKLKKANNKAKEKAQIDADNVDLAKKYSVYLANWYGNNNSFISGEIRVLGHPDYRVGTVLLRIDPSTDTSLAGNYVYYIESVSHEFSYTGGFTTVLGVTRGLPESVDRFATWNSYKSPLTAEKPGNGQLQLFNGGLFGELSVAEAADKGFKEANNDSDDDSGSSDSGEASSGSGDDYPSKWRDAVQDSLVDDWAYYNRECVSFVAWRNSQKPKYKDKKATEVPFYHLGNAAEWVSAKGSYGVSSPKAGDTAVFLQGAWGGSIGAYGHVAYITKVDGDNLYIEDYNAGNPMGQYNTHTIKKSDASFFLRF